jgi:lactate permease
MQMDHNLPITLFHWSIALIPIILLLVLLVVLRWKAAEAGAIGFFAAVAVAMLLYQTPFDTALVASGKGIWDAIFILLVVWPAILLYQVTKQAGGFDAIRIGIQKHTKNMLFLVLAFGWIFSSFLQGIAGFGAPIAIVAPLLVGLGVRPIMAVVIPLIGHAWANMFGTLAVGWIATLRVVDLENPPLTALYCAILLWIPNLLSGFAICWLYGKWKAVVHGLWAVLIISAIHGGGQLALTQVDPTLSNFIPATVALGAVFLLMQWSRYKEPALEESDVMESSGEEVGEEAEEEAPMGLHTGLFPYYVLTAITIVALGIPAVREWLEQFDWGLAFPATETGYGVTREAEQEYSPIEFLTHPGTYLLIASVVGYLWFKARGHYDQGAWRQTISGTVENAIPASVAILGFLTMSRMMDYSGQVTVLALGIAAVAPPVVFAFLSNFIGILGAFMTSSNTASNVLFAPLQQETAMALEGLTEEEVIAAQSTGGAIGNAIAPANVVLGTGTAGIIGKEGDVIRITLVYAGIAGVLVGLAGVVFYYLV